MDVEEARVEVEAVADAVVREGTLPDGKAGGEAVGEAALDEAHGAFEGLGWGEEEMDVVGHDDEGVQLVVAFCAVVLKGLQEELGVGGELEEAAGVVGAAGDEEGARAGGAGGDRHGGIVEGWGAWSS